MSPASTGVLFALLSLGFAGVLDIVFKRYSLKGMSKGMLLFGMGVMWGLLQLLTLQLDGHQPSLDTISLGYGLAAGALVTGSNLLLMESLTHLDVSLGSTLYRLNTVGVVILSVLFLLEPLSLTKLAGISFAVAAALLLYHRSHAHLAPDLLKTFFWVAVLASMLRAGFGVVTKAGLSDGADGSTMMLVSAACWILGGVAYAHLRERRIRITAEKMRYSIVAGVLVFLIVNTLFAALARGEASVLVPIANLSFIVALGISVALGMERFTARKALALGCAGVAIVLLAQLPA